MTTAALSPAQKPATVTTQVQFAVEVPREAWIDYLTKFNDIFGQNYCGYWLRGLDRNDDFGWLCWEQADNGLKPGEEQRAVRAWKAGRPLPAGWFRLDAQAAIKAYVEGVKRWGVEWLEEKGDATTYDIVVQLALLGEVRYG